ncbi:potassium-transporting ATPase subunit KdpC [Frondihabitans australicus]|uniref:Potassium-transporting ATPase KdpC subunit n=1 Tax=Frondihabitans australicus TaxID=386892 RepID=A0A495IKC2_9MICO|nr:potassium-transporting ATPase subunit KdpC [Frondihabitans australicus]RKR76414.1 K+-transporting ATPase ATPase C chain [Frondihabitans australicus]
MNTRSLARQWWVALRAMLVFTVVLGVAYTALVTGIAEVIAPAQAHGSTVSADGRVVGSSLIGQAFTSKSGKPLPQWFQSRPSAAGSGGGYDASASSASNLGPSNADLIAAVKARRAAVAAADGISPAAVPVDALTASGSGLDPDISPAYALDQVARIARVRALSEAVVHRLVESRIEGREAGYLGERTVNVLELNIALAQLSSKE